MEIIKIINNRPPQIVNKDSKKAANEIGSARNLGVTGPSGLPRHKPKRQVKAQQTAVGQVELQLCSEYTSQMRFYDVNLWVFLIAYLR